MQAAWLFFDMGSTIMNETPAMERRIRDSIAGTEITYEEIAAKLGITANSAKVIFHRAKKIIKEILINEE